MTPLETARAFLARGLSVIPIPRPRPGVPPNTPGDGKTAAIKWKDYQTRRPTDDELVAWFGGEPMNLAVVTGEVSGLVVIDADDGDALAWCTRELPPTPWQSKTGKGVHLWYDRPPGVRVPNRVRIETREGRWALDVRGDGGYVIAPPSVHANGAVYRFAGDWREPRERIPRFSPAWLERPDRPLSAPALAPPASARRSTDVLDRARRYLSAIPRPAIGAGSDAATLYAACRLVKGFALSPVDAETLLWEWCGGRAGWTREWVTQKVAHAERYGTEPYGALR
jgi:hypothetical protein